MYDIYTYKSHVSYMPLSQSFLPTETRKTWTPSRVPATASFFTPSCSFSYTALFLGKGNNNPPILTPTDFI